MSNEIILTKYLRKIGIPTEIKGYYIIRSAVLLLIEQPDIIMQGDMTRLLYPLLAREYKTTPSRVERAIRTAIEVTFAKDNTGYLQEVFGTVKPTNKAFLSLIADNLKIGLIEGDGDVSTD